MVSRQVSFLYSSVPGRVYNLSRALGHSIYSLWIMDKSLDLEMTWTLLSAFTERGNPHHLKWGVSGHPAANMHHNRSRIFKRTLLGKC